jgi:hypothetical protein
VEEEKGDGGGMENTIVVCVLRRAPHRLSVK